MWAVVMGSFLERRRGVPRLHWSQGPGISQALGGPASGHLGTESKGEGQPNRPCAPVSKRNTEVETSGGTPSEHITRVTANPCFRWVRSLGMQQGAESLLPKHSGPGLSGKPQGTGLGQGPALSPSPPSLWPATSSSVSSFGEMSWEIFVSQCGSQWGQLCLPEGIWPCLETFLVLITR